LGCARSGLTLEAFGDREGLPGGGSGGAAAAGSGGKGGEPPSRFEPERALEDHELFDLGVQAGEMTAESALFWTHATANEALELCVWREADGPYPELFYSVVTKPSPVGFVHQRVALEAGTRYRYAFFAQGRARRSALGRVTTAPHPEVRATPLRVGSVACTSFGYLPYRTLELLALEPLDFFVHAGDISYNDGSLTLQEFRDQWRTTLDSAGYRALLASTGAYFTWDDHEVTNDFDAEFFEQSSPEQFAAAREAYFESLAKRPNAIGGLWQSFRWGSTAELFILDCRGERRPSTLGSERPIFVSDAQLAWLLDGLAKSTAHFKIVLTSVPIGRLSEELYKSPSDRWEGYGAQRTELLSFIRERSIDNVWFLSGDLHIGLVHRVDREGPDAKLWEVCSGPAGQSSHDSGLFRPGNEAQYARAFPAEQVVYASPNLAYTTFEFDPAASAVRVRFVDMNGVVVFDRTLVQ
jgi:alkaline phosphatase D